MIKPSSISPLSYYLPLFALLIVSNAQTPNSYDFIIGDFNNDGKDDYIRKRTGDWAIDGQEGNPELFLATDAGQFESSPLRYEFDLRTNNVILHVGDFNGDGASDIFRQETGDWSPDKINTAYLLLADGNGDFTKHVLSEDLKLGADVVKYLLIADFNGDGKDDLFRHEYDIYNGSPTPAYVGATNILFAVDDESKFFEPVDFTPTIDLSEYMSAGMVRTQNYALVTGDFNGDGRADLIRFLHIPDFFNYTGILYLSNGDGSFEQRDLSDLRFGREYYRGFTFHVGDFNGDGNDDFVQGEDVEPSYLFLATGDGGFEAIALSEDVKVNSGDVLVGDFNGDGNADMFRQGTLYLSTGNSFVATQPLLPQGPTSRYYMGDFNGDSLSDILEHYGGDSESVFVYLSNDDGTFTS